MSYCGALGTSVADLAAGVFGLCGGGVCGGVQAACFGQDEGVVVGQVAGRQPRGQLFAGAL